MKGPTIKEQELYFQRGINIYEALLGHLRLADGGKELFLVDQESH